ncbi:hypothetical protein [Alkalicoccobacillus murimartini]|uniref:Outer membrane lipoprotein carrier protein LolA n=1 Tax=Alkalicoccobacillus murimartini TaxID=171685 RepID=A0ABT9YMP2_9BACI|nr:hypothetical protein [Alkalicoccobacillus murimartini]MDQ0209021.1 hypothetical protein [Alkalicoccobacillus murimartini]
MKKAAVLTISGAVFLAACSNEEPMQSETADASEEVEQNDMNQDDTESTDEEPPSPEEIVEQAIAFYDDLHSLYLVAEGENHMDLDAEQENVPEGNISMFIREEQWNFIEDGKLYTRLEMESYSEGDEDGESFSEEMPNSIQFSDLDDPAFTITYDEGDDEAIRYEPGVDPEQADLTDWASPYENMLENAELTYIGEEEVNGYQTYHIESDLDGEVTEYWFDQETYYEIMMERATSADEEHSAGDLDSSNGVIDFEVNPDFDESLFQAPDDIEVVDGELEDTIGS